MDIIAMAFLINFLIVVPVLLLGLDTRGTTPSASIAEAVARFFGRQTAAELPIPMADTENRPSTDSQNGFPEIVCRSLSERPTDQTCDLPFSSPRTSFVQRPPASKKELKGASAVAKQQSTVFGQLTAFLVNFAISVGAKLKAAEGRVEGVAWKEIAVREGSETVSRGPVAPVSRPERRKRNPFDHFPSLVSPAIPGPVQLLLAKKLIAIDRRIKTQRQAVMPRIVFELPGQEELGAA